MGTLGTTGLSGGLSGGGGALVLISKQKLAVAAASVTFGAGHSLPNGYTDLILSILAATDAAVAAENVNVVFSADTGANYYTDSLNRFGNAQQAGANSATIGVIPGSSAPPGSGNAIEMVMPGYSQLVLIKNGTWQNFNRQSNAGSGLIAQIGGIAWNSTAAIDQIDLKPAAGNFLAGSLFTLYGRG